MRITIASTQLHRAAMAAARTAGGPTDPPHLQAILLSARDSTLEVRSCNLDAETAINLPCQVLSEGAVAVPAHLLTAATGHLEGLSAELESNGNTLRIASGPVAFELFCTARPEDLPAPMAADPQQALVVPAQILHTAISTVMHAADRAPHRLSLSGVRVESDGHTLTVCATDGVRLAAATVQAEQGSPFAATVPLRAAQALAAAVSQHPGQATLTVSQNSLVLELGATRIACRTLPYPFPAWRPVVEKAAAGGTRITAETAGLLAAILAAATTARDDARTVTLAVSHDGLSVCSATADAGSTTATVPGAAVETPGNVRCAFNCAYLADSLRACPGTTVTITLSDPLTPCLVACEETNGVTYQEVIAPIRTS